MTAIARGFDEAQAPDMERRLAGLIRFGTIAELDESKARVKVKAGEITTGWLPWTLGRAGPDSHWTAPEVGEQVIMAAPSGDLAQAVVLGSVYQNKHPAPGNSKDKTITQWKDGAKQSYDRAAHVFELDVPSGGAIRLKVGSGALEIKNDRVELSCGGSTIELTAAGIKLNGARIDIN